jgi:ankyrin repeat protein
VILNENAITKILIDHGAKVNIKDTFSESPLMLAATAGNIDIMNLLIGAGAKEPSDILVNLIIPWMHKGRSEIVRILLSAGVGQDGKVKDMKSFLLSLASANDSLEIVKELISAGADVNHLESGTHFTTPLVDALLYDNIHIADFLLSQGGVIKADTVSLDNAALNTVKNGNNKYFKLLIQAGALNSAVMDGKFSEALSLLIEKNDTVMINELLKTNKYTSVNTGNQMTPLQLAASDGKANIIKTLIDAGANVDEVGSYEERRPLELTINNAHVDAARILLKAGANVNAKSVSGRTMLEIAGENKALIELLRSYGAK